MKTFEEIDIQDSAAQTSGGIGIPDVVRMLFKHKWLLIGFVLLGIAGAATMYVNHVAQYESTSKILVRYVEEVSNVDPTEDGRGRGNPIESVITAEVEILQSWDLAKEVVDVLSPEVLLGKSEGASRDLASQVFIKGLEVNAPKGGRVITVTYRHANPETAVKALSTLVRLYQEKHVEIHRATKSRDTSRNRRNALNARITDLNEQIERLKVENGISSLAEAANGLNRRSDELRGQLAAAETDLQEQRAKMTELTRLGIVKEAVPDSETATAAAATPFASDRAAHTEYQGLMKRLAQLQDEQARIIGIYKPTSPELQANRAEIEKLDAQRIGLEKKHPGLFSAGPAIVQGAPLPSSIDPTTEAVRLATLAARVELLKKKHEATREEFKQFSVVSKKLHELERERELQSEGLKHFAASFQRNEFEAPLSADQYDNIVVVQSSSPPVLALNKLFKLMAGVCFGVIALGLALVALLELVVNRSLKRPMEMEARVGIPLMCNIPRISYRVRKALQDRASKKESGLVGVEAWSSNHFIRPFSEVLRDRLVLYFEQVGLTRKPKLVGIASYSKGAGVSTVASGIASALSETGDGKVLLVDMNTAHAEVHPFFQGKPASSLVEALESPARIESAADNLYLATASGSGNRSAQLFPKRFYDMMPTLQASEFDYIIFDMPPMDESSLTLAMSGYMDKLLLVVEAEKDNRDAVKRASGELLRAKAKLSGVLNKTRSYGPKWLQEA